MALFQTVAHWVTLGFSTITKKKEDKIFRKVVNRIYLQDDPKPLWQ